MKLYNSSIHSMFSFLLSQHVFSGLPLLLSVIVIVTTHVFPGLPLLLSVIVIVTIHVFPGLPLLLSVIAIGVQIDLKNPDDV